MKKNRVQAKKSQEQAEKQLSKATIGEIWGAGKWKKNLFAPVDISSIVFFRVLFGMIMFYEVARYLDTDWIYTYWIKPDFHFTYWPFDFLTPLPGNGMYILFYVMGLLSVFIILGFFYRASMVLFFLCFSYMFLLEQTRYMNHFYLIILVSFVMIFIPANASASLDSKIFKNIRSETAPAWSLWLLRFMIAIPYFFGGVAKITPDWLQGQPLAIWLAYETDFPVIGSLFEKHWMILFMAYSGMFLDLLIVPALLFKKTRVWGFVAITMFHLMNSELFVIGIFPWFMIVATSLYFDPDWPRKQINSLTRNAWPIVLSGKETLLLPTVLSGRQKAVLAGLVLWVSIQVLLPFRHFFIPGDVHWTEEGHRYSWHMKLRTKKGTGNYIVKDKKTGETVTIDARDYLTSLQVQKMSGRPYLIWQFCQMVKEDYKRDSFDVAVYADIKASLNGRKYQQLIDPSVDLTSVPRPLLPAKWIVPLSTPLSDRLEKNDESGSEE